MWERAANGDANAGHAALAYFWIAFGSALGGVGRYWCSEFIARQLGETFPWGTIFVNVAGSFVIGFVATLSAPDGRMIISSDARLFITVGLCGGYTTFSCFSLQTLNLVQNGEWLRAGGNVIGSVVLCLLAVWVGHAAAAGINQLKGI